MVLYDVAWRCGIIRVIALARIGVGFQGVAHGGIGRALLGLGCVLLGHRILLSCAFPALQSLRPFRAWKRPPIGRPDMKEAPYGA